MRDALPASGRDLMYICMCMYVYIYIYIENLWRAGMNEQGVTGRGAGEHGEWGRIGRSEGTGRCPADVVAHAHSLLAQTNSNEVGATGN